VPTRSSPSRAAKSATSTAALLKKKKKDEAAAEKKRVQKTRLIEKKKQLKEDKNVAKKRKESNMKDDRVTGNEDGGQENLENATLENATLELHSDSEEAEEEVKTKRQKKANFSCAEDIALCKAWASASMDPIHGANKRVHMFATELKTRFEFILGLTDDCGRTADSLLLRFRRVIAQECTKILALYKSDKSKNPSGKREQDIIDDAVKTYFTQLGKPVRPNSKECFEILYLCPKFNSTAEAINPSLGSDSKVHNGATIAMAGDLPRPIGCKKAKKAQWFKEKKLNQETIDLSSSPQPQTPQGSSIGGSAIKAAPSAIAAQSIATMSDVFAQNFAATLELKRKAEITARAKMFFEMGMIEKATATMAEHDLPPPAIILRPSALIDEQRVKQTLTQETHDDGGLKLSFSNDSPSLSTPHAGAFDQSDDESVVLDNEKKQDSASSSTPPAVALASAIENDKESSIENLTAV
jgi:hypothetical protein